MGFFESRLCCRFCSARFVWQKLSGGDGAFVLRGACSHGPAGSSRLWGACKKPEGRIRNRLRRPRSRNVGLGLFCEPWQRLQSTGCQFGVLKGTQREVSSMLETSKCMCVLWPFSSWLNGPPKGTLFFGSKSLL